LSERLGNFSDAFRMSGDGGVSDSTMLRATLVALPNVVSIRFIVRICFYLQGKT
jgi:hypothetical protein